MIFYNRKRDHLLQQLVDNPTKFVIQQAIKLNKKLYWLAGFMQVISAISLYGSVYFATEPGKPFIIIFVWLWIGILNVRNMMRTHAWILALSKTHEFLHDELDKVERRE